MTSSVSDHAPAEASAAFPSLADQNTRAELRTPAELGGSALPQPPRARRRPAPAPQTTATGLQKHTRTRARSRAKAFSSCRLPPRRLELAHTIVNTATVNAAKSSGHTSSCTTLNPLRARTRQRNTRSKIRSTLAAASASAAEQQRQLDPPRARETPKSALTNRMFTSAASQFGRSASRTALECRCRRRPTLVRPDRARRPPAARRPPSSPAANPAWRQDSSNGRVDGEQQRRDGGGHEPEAQTESFSQRHLGSDDATFDCGRVTGLC